MRPTRIRILALALLSLVMAQPARAQMPSPEAIADYERRLAEYQAVHDAYEADASTYWGAIAEKRRCRNAKRREHQPVTLDDYVLTQPPVYTGPAASAQSGGRTRAGSNAAPEEDHSRGRRSPAGGFR
jgi:hypothetical protein